MCVRVLGHAGAVLAYAAVVACSNVSPVARSFAPTIAQRGSLTSSPTSSHLMFFPPDVSRYLALRIVSESIGW